MNDFEADIVVKDGSILHVRSFRPDDKQLLLEFVKGLSQEAFYFRFFGAGLNTDVALDALLGRGDGFAIIALRDGRVVAHVAYYISGPGTAEIGVVVAEEYRQKGLGTILLGQLAEVANHAGIGTFESIVVPENYRMIDMMSGLGFPIAQRIEPGLIRITYPTSLLPEAVELFQSREALATAAAVHRFLSPKGVALIGASRNRSGIGGQLFCNLIEGDFNGAVYPVNSKSSIVQSVPAYRSVMDCPGQVDLALIAVPAHDVSQVARECAKKGVSSLVVISSGFSESGKEGAKLQNELVQVCRESGMRLIGPNCMGIVNTDPTVRLNAQFSPLKPSPGKIGFLSQSGALGIAVIDASYKLGLGMSSFVSVGNKADISGNDLIQYWETDPNTDLILLYLESFGNPRKFSTIARRVTKKKPIVAVKSGRSSAGFRATQSHTGAILSSSDITVDALFKQAGVIRTDTLEEMFDAAALLSSQPIPKGNRVGIITNAGGAGILAADACESLGIDVPELSEETQASLKTFLPTEAGVRNPVDMIASANASDYSRTIRAVASDAKVDALIIIFIPPIAVKPEEIANEILKADRDLGHRLPFIATFMASRGITNLLSDGYTRVPSYPFPESAARALSHAVHYGNWIRKPLGHIPSFNDTRKSEAAALVARSLKGGGGWLAPDEVDSLLNCYGIPTIKTIRVPTAEEAGQAAQKLGGAVVLKAIAPGLLHKIDVGAVKLSLQGRVEVESAARNMTQDLSHSGLNVSGFLVQPMLSDSVEMFIGITHDPMFGPVVACGAGGTYIELMKDVSVRLTPLTEEDVDEMLTSLKTYPLLSGYRGASPADTQALREIILRVGNLADELLEVAELDLNPVMVCRDRGGAYAVDSRIRIGPAAHQTPLGAKR